MELGFFTMPLHPPGSDTTKTLDHDIEQMVILDELGYKESVCWRAFYVYMGEYSVTRPLHRKSSCDDREHRLRHWDHVYADTQSRRCRAFASRNLTIKHTDALIGGSAPVPRRAMQRCSWRTEIDGSQLEKGLKQFSRFGRIQNPDITRAISGNLKFPKTVRTSLACTMKPYQKPHPPIAMAGSSARSDTLVLAGERGWIPMSINLAHIPIIKTHWDAVEEGAEKAGLSPSRSTWRIAREVYVADTTEQARKEGT